MKYFSNFARDLRAAGLGILAVAAFASAAAAQDGQAPRVSQTLTWHSADRSSAVAALPASVMPRVAPTGWKAVLVGGHHLIDSYNNAASALADRLRGSGVQRVAVLHSTGIYGGGGALPAREREMRRALGALGSTAGDACLVFITSHANERGIYLSADRGYLSPRELSRMVDAECGERPTVLILSGCGTGAFITSALRGDNRIIIAASARGRVSYGATTTDRYVNFDRCMIRAIDAGARTWREVFDRTLPCVGARERELGVAPSQPQAWFGAQVAELPLPGRL
jgi:hypothetical protein